MKKDKQEPQIDELTRERISKLQWKKDAKNTDERVAAFMVDILYGDKWTLARYNKMDAEGKRLFNLFVQTMLDSLAGSDHDSVLEKVELLITEESKRNIEEAKYVRIANAIDRLTMLNNRFPARLDITL